MRSSLLSFFTLISVSSASPEAVEVWLTATKVVASLVSIVFSSCTYSSSSSESLRMMILPSPDDPRMSRLRSPKSLPVNSSSRETSAMRPSSSKDEERSTTGVFPEGPPCSNTGEQGWHEEISDGDPDGGGDLDGVSGGVLVSLGDGLPSLEGEPSVWYLSCPPLLASREQERRMLKASEKEKRTARWLSA
jgi:hypothetical protein